MRVLIISQYFWPENFRINDLASYFAEVGHEVTVLTGKPNYPEGILNPDFRANPDSFVRYGNVEICRVPMTLRGKSKVSLALNYMSFFISASIIGVWRIRRESFDLIFVFGASPITVAIPAIIIKKFKKIPIFLWVLDLWPESLSAVGVLRSKRVLQIVGYVVSWIYKWCDHILIQSRSFRQSIQQYCVDADMPGKVLYFPSWAEEIFSQSSLVPQNDVLHRADKFTAMFAGNLGEAQDLPALLDAAERLKSNRRIRWIIMGDGRMHKWLFEEVIRRGLSECFHMVGRHPVEEMPAFFECADVLIVTLKRNDIFSRTIPGKVQSYLAYGKPIVGMIDGEARRIIEESGCGRVCASGDSECFAKTLEELACAKAEDLTKMGQMGRQYYEAHFERRALLARLEAYFKAAVSKQLR
jgi:glycosyltransferase involved in cell wall biosynthesis